jgi:hypothetical protein
VIEISRKAFDGYVGFTRDKLIFMLAEEIKRYSNAGGCEVFSVN